MSKSRSNLSKSRTNLDEDEVMTSSSAEEYTKVLRRKMISEVLHQKPQNHEIWQLQQQKQPQSQPQRVSRPNEAKSRPSSRTEQRRSHSAQGKRSSAASNVNAGAEPQPKNVQNRPGLGRRSATQLELSRRKRNEEDGMGTPIRQSKWRSQEHLDQVNVPPLP